ncbi:MAG: hypothetical protein HY077_10235 [Elusimicrobia bacterium]|nr:hypothetical protein [Elusimicrobiota bacterium]
MGRTLPTIIQALHAEEEVWKHFRRALRREDQEAFDALWRWARRHAAPAAMASRPMPFEAALMGMLVALARRVMEMDKNEDRTGGLDL